MGSDVLVSVCVCVCTWWAAGAAEGWEGGGAWCVVKRGVSALTSATLSSTAAGRRRGQPFITTADLIDAPLPSSRGVPSLSRGRGQLGKGGCGERARKKEERAFAAGLWCVAHTHTHTYSEAHYRTRWCASRSRLFSPSIPLHPRALSDHAHRATHQPSAVFSPSLPHSRQCPQFNFLPCPLTRCSPTSALPPPFPPPTSPPSPPLPPSDSSPPGGVWGTPATYTPELPSVGSTTLGFSLSCCLPNSFLHLLFRPSPAHTAFVGLLFFSTSRALPLPLSTCVPHVFLISSAALLPIRPADAATAGSQEEALPPPPALPPPSCSSIFFSYTCEEKCGD